MEMNDDISLSRLYNDEIDNGQLMDVTLLNWKRLAFACGCSFLSTCFPCAPGTLFNSDV